MDEKPKERGIIMDVIETLLSVDQLWFQTEINKLIHDGYSILYSNTICDNDNNIVWTAILKNSKKGY